MNGNVGGIERKLRIVGGLLLIGIGALARLSFTTMGILFGVGAILLLTGAIGYCPLSALLGVNTCSTKPTARK